MLPTETSRDKCSKVTRHDIQTNDEPVGVEHRKRHVSKRRIYSSLGPNDCWHVDGFDTLKPLSFVIHECIDGHSRKVLSLKVDISNNNPKIRASFFMEFVTSLRACTRKVRTDCRTENVLPAAMQRFLRKNHSDELSGSALLRNFSTELRNRKMIGAF